jgi:hypothetical protein
MARVTRPGGVVAASVWDHGGGNGPLSLFWDAARELEPGVHDESQMAGARAGHLTELFEAAGLREVTETSLAADLQHATFEEWWQPFVLGVGPAGQYAAGLDPERLAGLRDACRRRLPGVPFVITARAWAARGLA